MSDGVNKKCGIAPFLSFTGKTEKTMNYYISVLPGAEITKLVRYGKDHPFAGEGEENIIL